ncbi:MAG: VWA domain-containing protein [Treponema sp.]|jgi:Mg-chelatase subunit ChlD|nr:VWA domain-containing protein [Treponema sp.]
MIRKITLVFALIFAFCLPLIQAQAQDISIGAEDIRIELRADGGVHLFIRKKPGISSVLLTETTRDPELRSDNFAYRAAEWNPVNGDEIRILDGFPIPRENRIYSLISSTPETHQQLGEAFHIYIPWIIFYGYDNTRHGAVILADGTYMNIRSFAFPYGDYRGSFMDNPFLLRITQREDDEPPEGKYSKEAEDSFRQITRDGRGSLLHAASPKDLTDSIKTILEREKGNAVDLVICMDTTGSMRPYIDDLRRRLIPMLNEMLAQFTEFRIGLLLFRDYNEEYLTRIVPFTENFEAFQRSLNSAQARGGGDIPEAVYEALYDGAVKFPWEKESRIMILIGDAPPHPKPRGRITKELVDKTAAEKNIKVHAILLPE